LVCIQCWLLNGINWESRAGLLSLKCRVRYVLVLWAEGEICLHVFLLYISLRVEFSKKSRTRVDVIVLGQFDINDRVEKIWHTCHLCWCSTLIPVNNILRYLAQFWGRPWIHCQKIRFLIMFLCLVGYIPYLNSLSILHCIEICECSQAFSAVLCHSLCTCVDVHDNFCTLQEFRS
jgi:hypothetical protein